VVGEGGAAHSDRRPQFPREIIQHAGIARSTRIWGAGRNHLMQSSSRPSDQGRKAIQRIHLTSLVILLRMHCHINELYLSILLLARMPDCAFSVTYTGSSYGQNGHYLLGVTTPGGTIWRVTSRSAQEATGAITTQP
jgi:hypothetical protein